METTLGRVKRYINKIVAKVVAIILRPGAVFDPENFKLWERRGYHILPIHFYWPVPNTIDIEKKQFQPSELPGMDLRPKFQLRLMKETFSRFSQEYASFPTEPTGSGTFYLDNDAFGGIDPYVYYCMIRHFQPRTVIEVGSGHSTLLGSQACRLNRETRYLCIDPWPRDFVSEGNPGVEFIREKVEDLDLALFLQLQQNDILFIDSSHVIRTAGDVCFLLLEVLPRLAEGVIVHLHDIFLPFDYPKEWIVERQRFWTEQYLLQAYLADNDHVEVLFSSHFISQRHTEDVRQAFPNAIWIGGGSFWIRKH